MKAINKAIQIYAGYKIYEIAKNEIMDEQIKIKSIDKINECLQTYSKDLITVDETIKVILEA